MIKAPRRMLRHIKRLPKIELPLQFGQKRQFYSTRPAKKILFQRHNIPLQRENPPSNDRVFVLNTDTKTFNEPLSPSKDPASAPIIKPSSPTPAPAKTPLIKQIQRLQKENPDHVLFIQVGDFYEIYDFNNSLDEIAELLNIRVTKLKKGKKDPIRFSGFPISSMMRFAQILLKAGRMVAVADQVPREGIDPAKGGLDRIVTRRLTPGTVLDEALLTESENNFILSIAVDKDSIDAGQIGLSWSDLSTGEFFFNTTTLEELDADIVRIGAKEIIVAADALKIIPALADILPKEMTHYKPASLFDPTGTQYRFLRLLTKTNPAGTLLKTEKQLLRDYKHLEVIASGALLNYVISNHIGVEPSLQAPVFFERESVMTIDPVALQSLEIVSTVDGDAKGSLMHSINKTKTNAGSRLLLQRLKAPSQSISTINARLDLVARFHHDTDLLATIQDQLSQLKDIERALQRLHYKKGGPIDFFNIMSSMKNINELKEMLDIALSRGLPIHVATDPVMTRGHEELRKWTNQITTFHEIVAKYDNILRNGAEELNRLDVGIIQEGFHERIDYLIRKQESLKQQQLDLEDFLRKEFGCSVKLGESQSLGPYLEVTSPAAVKRMEPFVKAFADKEHPHHLTKLQQLSSKSKYRCRSWTELWRELSLTSQQLANVEREVFNEACQEVLNFATELRQTSRALAEIDVAASFAALARQRNYIRPEIITDPTLTIHGGRHPVVEVAQQLRSVQYIKNDTHLENDSRLIVLTGPNMGGKSTFLRQIALITIMAQSGSFVPADTCRLGIVDKIFSRVGASDDIKNNRSTFMVEMSETARILHTATPKSLVIMDEIGRGTSAIDGQALATSILEYVHDRIHCRTVFATHYVEVAEEVETNPSRFSRAQCWRTKIWEGQNGEFAYVYKVERGIMRKSFGVHVAQLAGLPVEVLEAARERCKILEERRMRVLELEKRGLLASVILDDGVIKDENKKRMEMGNRAY